LVEQISADRQIDRAVFNDATYFGELTSDYSGKEKTSIDFGSPLRNIVNRWRMFHFHYYLAVALESLFVYVVRQAREAGLRGVAHSDLLAVLNSTSTQKAVSRRLGRALPQRFLQMTPQDIAAVCGVDIRTANLAGSKSFD